MTHIVYVALNLDVWESWVSTFALKGIDIYDQWRPSRPGCKHPPLWVFKECRKDKTIRPYFHLTKEVLAWFHQAVSRANDPAKAALFGNLLKIAADYLPIGEIQWALDTTEPQRLPQSGHLARPIQGARRPVGPRKLEPNPKVPAACKIDTPEYKALEAFASNYDSTSGKTVFGRHYPSAVDHSVPPELIRRQRKKGTGAPSPLAGIRRRLSSRKKSLREL